MNQSHRDFQELLDEYISDPQFAADLLSDALEHEDIETFLLSLKDVLRIHGSLASIAEKANISRTTLYSMFSASVNPSLRTLLSVLHAAGYDLTVTKRPPARLHRRQPQRERR